MNYSTDDILICREDYKSLTREQLAIPGLSMIGHRIFRCCSGILPFHHHNTMEIVVTLKGKHHFYVEKGSHTLYGGDIFMTYPEEPHSGGNSFQNICEYVWFQFDLSSPENFLNLSPKYSQYVFEQLTNYNHRVKRAYNQDLSSLKDAFFLLSSDELPKQILGYNYFIHFVLNNLCGIDTPSKQDSREEDIHEALTYIHAHLTEDLDINTIAKYIKLSPTTFNIKFKEQLGITPHAYISSLRVDTAKVLLKNPSYSITEIAYKLNFSSSNHFATVFKKHTGYTPTKFKNSRFKDTL